MKPRVGLSVRLAFPDPARPILPQKTLQYCEDGMAQWLLGGGAVVYPLLAPADTAVLADYAEDLDGLVLQGGADIAPAAYGEKPLRPEWAGDPVRDAYELALLREFLERRKPVLGICRGCQLLNVAFGGTLFQDLPTQHPEAQGHRSEPLYDRHFHGVRWDAGSTLAALYPGRSGGTINSIHHQGLNQVGAGLVAEAWSDPDGIIEAVRGAGPGYIRGVQWHPEFVQPGDSDLLPSGPLLAEFLSACSS